MSEHAAAAHAHPDFVTPADWPEDPQYGKATLGKLGMWIFLLSDALSFAGLLLAYGILRGGSTHWHNPGEPELGIPFTAGLTFLLICSSVTMVLGYAAAVENKRKQATLFLGLTALGGVLFLCGQAHEYHGLSQEGLHFGASAYASTFYVITSFHGFHVFTGVTYLTIITIATALGKFDNGNYNRIEVAGLFWHFVDLIWILVFTFVYLVPTQK
ncbi:MAG TPA: cytochrome c oxidase subunit 3 [Polyangia bacterium]|nr:cytochrome c oxidase subunit 3 [Polyangia bacterium]